LGRRLGELKADYGVGGDTGTVVFQCEQYCARTLLQLLTAVIGTTQNVLAALFTGQKPKVATRHFAKHALPELNLIGSEEAEDRHLDHTVNSRIPGRTVEIKQHGLVRQGQTRLDELGRGDFAIVRFERTRSDLIF